jgi:GNAT superfamily N-acetyltransferase
MTPEDVGAALSLCRLAGWNQRAEDWQTLLANGVFRVATRDATIHGTGGAVVYGRELAWVAMILVDPGARRQGIATRVMQDVLACLEPVAVVGLDATPQGAAVYGGLGFTDRGGFARMERPVDAEPVRAQPEPVRPEHAPASPRPLTAADLAALSGRDHAVFGADACRALDLPEQAGAARPFGAGVALVDPLLFSAGAVSEAEVAGGT